MNPQPPPHPVEASLQRLLDKTEEFVRREPAKAVAVAFGAGLLLKLLPPRAVARPLAAVTAKLLPPTLLGLGLIKALELARTSGCCQQPDLSPVHSP